MYNYSIDAYTTNYQLLAKECLNLDKSITSVMNLIDLLNPNYFILNVEYVARQGTFYTKQELEQIKIINDKDNPTYIFLDSMRSHQIVVNNFGKDMVLKNNEDSSFKLNTIPEGFAVIKERKDYSIISLDSSGAYYVLDSIVSSNNENYSIYNWIYYENAIDDVGQYYLISFLPSGTRLTYKGTNNWLNIDNTLEYSLTYSYDSDHNNSPLISSINGTFWTITEALGHELTTQIAEEVFCDETFKTVQHVQNKQPIAGAIFTSNLQSCDNLNFYLNFF